MRAGNQNTFGKKCFFLYPHSVIVDELILKIIENGYEVYLIHDHVNLKKLLRKYNDSIAFINIDKVLKEPEWKEYTKGIINNDKTKNVLIGILTYSENAELSKTYLFDIMVHAGFIQLKAGLKESFRILLKTLAVNEVKGQRKYVRVKCEDDTNTSFNFDYEGRFCSGIIKDISIVGMACTFNERISLPPRTRLNRIQLKLRGRLVMVSGVIAGKRIEDQKEIIVILFTSYISEQGKEKVCNYISKKLQSNLEEEVKAVAAMPE